MNIYVQIEIKIRELEAKLLLACRAAQRGHEVYLGDIWDFVRLAQKKVLAPGIMHLKDLAPEEKKLNWQKIFRERGFRMTSQDEESGLLSESYDEFARQRFSDESLGMCDFNFCWGPHDTTSLQRVFPQHTEKIVETGSPRIDLCRTDFDPYYSASPLSRHTGGKEVVLIASNFAWTTGKNSLWAYFTNYLKSGYIVEGEDSEFELFARASRESILLLHYIRAIRRLSREHPEILFVFRPHPIENESAWEHFLAGLPNVRVIKDLGIGHWIKAAKLLIHTGCTTSMESAYAGLPILTFRPSPPPFANPIPNSLGWQVAGEDELVAAVRRILTEGKSIYAEQHEKDLSLVHRFFSPQKEAIACDQIVQAWESIKAEGLTRRNNLLRLKTEYLWWEKVRPIGRNLLVQLKLHQPAIFDNAYKFTPITAPEKNSLMRQITHQVPESKGLTVQSIGRRLLRIAPSK